MKVGLKAVIEAEKISLKYFDTAIKTKLKSDRSPVTKADKKAELAMKKIIFASFPSHGFFGEEYGKQAENSEYLWTIDPIDGTKNFTRGLPFFTNELALIHNGEIVLGISNTPLLGKRFHAMKGRGAFLNGKKTSVTKVDKLDEAYISYGGIQFFDKLEKLKSLSNLASSCRSYRSFGDAWSYQLLSEGKIDIVCEAKFGDIYDVAAQVIIIREAGGRVTDMEGKEFDLNSKTVVATNDLLHEEVLGYFN